MTTTVDAAVIDGPTALRRERHRRGVSQERLAELSAISERTVRGLESGAVGRPRRTSVEQVAIGLGLRGDDQRDFLAAWGFETGSVVRTVDDMLGPVADHADLLDAVRGRIEQCAVSYLCLEAEVRGRRVCREQRDTVVVPTTSGITGTVHVVRHGAPGTTVSMTALEGCRIGGRTQAGDLATIFGIDFGVRVTVGSAHHYRVHTDFHRAAQPERLDSRVLIGFHRAPAVFLLRVRFDPLDPPSRLARVYTSRMGTELDDVGKVDLGPDGMAQVVTTDPASGWHGIRWEWGAPRPTPSPPPGHIGRTDPGGPLSW